MRYTSLIVRPRYWVMLGMPEETLWRIIWIKSANDKIANCTCGNAYSAPLHNLYATHENSILSFHRRVVAAILISPSLILYSSS
jgi:hypothetical protein